MCPFYYSLVQVEEAVIKQRDAAVSVVSDLKYYCLIKYFIVTITLLVNRTVVAPCVFLFHIHIVVLPTPVLPLYS